ncbi:MAG: hypothetical protein K0S27_1005 [Gammaproteobacteria bacterium]|jgi:ankyrin repeat protein|nr:hypothetical protein [Gammaproteobacteria bacterium]
MLSAGLYVLDSGAAPSAAPISTLCDAILKDDIPSAQRQLEADSSLVNICSDAPYHATPLIIALIRLNELQKIAKEAEDKVENEKIAALEKKIAALGSFIDDFLLGIKDLDFTKTDAKGNTALHHAGWYGLDDFCYMIIVKAKIKNQLNQLLFIRNIHNWNINDKAGGNTAFENICVGVPDKEKRKGLHIRMYPSPLSFQGKQGKVDLNEHLSYDVRATQLMNSISGVILESEAEEIIKEIQSSKTLRLYEPDVNGQTALHVALQKNCFQIATVIIEKAEELGQLEHVLAARNNTGLTAEGGGEVPHISCVVVGFSLFQKLQNYIQNKKNKRARRVKKELIAWHVFATQLKEKLQQFNIRQSAEFNYLLTVYGKFIEGSYDAQRFSSLEAVPLAELNRLKEMLAIVLANQEQEAGEYACFNSLLNVHLLLECRARLNKQKLLWEENIQKLEAMAQKKGSNVFFQMAVALLKNKSAAVWNLYDCYASRINLPEFMPQAQYIIQVLNLNVEYERDFDVLEINQITKDLAKAALDWSDGADKKEIVVSHLNNLFRNIENGKLTSINNIQASVAELMKEVDDGIPMSIEMHETLGAMLGLACALLLSASFAWVSIPLALAVLLLGSVVGGHVGGKIGKRKGEEKDQIYEQSIVENLLKLKINSSDNINLVVAVPEEEKEIEVSRKAVASIAKMINNMRKGRLYSSTVDNRPSTRQKTTREFTP